MKRPQFVNGEIYHIVMRGVGDAEIFRTTNDYYRGIFSLYEFNDVNAVSIRDRREVRLAAKRRGVENFSAERDQFVGILAFCFMPNHIHLILQQIKDDGISKFMQKFGTGYASYFNKKYNRKGHLFGRFHAVHIKNDLQLQIGFVYVHCNPLSLIEPKWREVGVKNSRKATKFLENYKFSSYSDYIGKNNFPSVTTRAFLSKIMGGKKGCRNFVQDWIRHKKELRDWHRLDIE